MTQNRNSFNSGVIEKPSVHPYVLKQQQNDLLIDEILSTMDIVRYIKGTNAEDMDNNANIDKKEKIFIKEATHERIAEEMSENMAEEVSGQNEQIDQQENLIERG